MFINCSYLLLEIVLVIDEINAALVFAFAALFSFCRVYQKHSINVFVLHK